MGWQHHAGMNPKIRFATTARTRNPRRGRRSGDSSEGCRHGWAAPVPAYSIWTRRPRVARARGRALAQSTRGRISPPFRDLLRHVLPMRADAKVTWVDAKRRVTAVEHVQRHGHACPCEDCQRRSRRAYGFATYGEHPVAATASAAPNPTLRTVDAPGRRAHARNQPLDAAALPASKGRALVASFFPDRIIRSRTRQLAESAGGLKLRTQWTRGGAEYGGNRRSRARWSP
jgi:hypothetical protein